VQSMLETQPIGSGIKFECGVEFLYCCVLQLPHFCVKHTMLAASTRTCLGYLRCLCLQAAS
jgi:hypothetical protein